MSNTLTPESGGRLINLKTNLKSLRFGGDRPDSGTSNQPYIVEPIPGQIIDGNSNGPFAGLNNALSQGVQFLDGNLPSNSGPDFLLRGGLTAPLRALKDVSRLVKMFTDDKSPRGLYFTLKENLLSRTNVKTQASFGTGYLAGVMNQGAFLPVSTILQAGFGWAGVHINKNGINPIGSLGGPSGMNRGIDNPLKSDGANQVGVGGGALNLYSAVVKNDQDEAINRLTNLQYFIEEGEKGKSRKENKNFQKEQGLNAIQRAFKNNGARFKYNPTANKENPRSPVLYSYGGGPGSILGVGRTLIFREQPTYNAIRNYQNLTAGPEANVLFSGASIGENGRISPLLVGRSLTAYADENGLLNVGGKFPESFSNAVIADFPKAFEESRVISLAPNYQTQNKAKRVNIGDPGQHATYRVNAESDISRNVFNYGIAANQMEALDKITAMKIYESDGAPPPDLPTNDLVKFRIAVIKNGINDFSNAQYLHFRAYINGFTDNYSATWNDVQYVGRGNTFKSYSGFNRDIAMGFTVMATSKAELIPMMAKLNFLASTLAPDYSDSGFMRGNIVRMTMGGYLYEVPGVLTSLTYTIPDDTTWEIAIGPNGERDDSVNELPHRIEVQLSFVPIENFLPSRQKLTYDTDGVLTSVSDQRFISLNNKIGMSNSGYEGDNSIINYRQQITTQNTNE